MKLPESGPPSGPAVDVQHASTSQRSSLRVRPNAPGMPEFRAPCNGCGVCCHVEPCGIAREYIPGTSRGPCPALVYQAGRFVCGMTIHPSRYMGLPNDWADAIIGNMFAGALGIGRGCDSGD